jgi:glycosyltransferase involved in cell wall biosynthesis
MVGRALFVVNGHEYTARHRLPLIDAFQREGFDVHCAAPENSESLDLLSRTGVPCHPLPMSRRGLNPLSELRTMASLARLYAVLQPRVIYHATIKPVLYGSIAARTVRSATVLNAITGLGSVFTASGPKAAVVRAVVLVLYRFALRGPRTVALFQNRDDRAYLAARLHLPDTRTALVPGSGVDMTVFAPSPAGEDPPLVLFVGRMLRDKGVGTFVSVAAIVRQRFPRARFVLIGETDEGNPTSLSREQLVAWQQMGTVEWWGARTELQAIYPRAALVVLPSLREGLPKVLVEAAACGLPVVASDVPGCRDAVVHGETGFLCAADDAAGMARRVEELLGNPARARLMGVAARARAEREFSVHAVAAATMGALQRAEGGAAGRAMQGGRVR